VEAVYIGGICVAVMDGTFNLVGGEAHGN
jgi:hypothetical protein